MCKIKGAEGSMYHIRIQGNLDPKWVDWFEGLVLTSRGDGETVLVGTVADQAALYGLLAKINTLGLPLLLVVRVDEASAANFCPTCGRYIADWRRTPDP